MKLLIHPEHFDIMASRFEARLSAEANEELASFKHEGERVAAPVAVTDGVARIDVKGPLLDAPDWFFDWLGVQYSDYQTITAQLQQANGNPDVSSIVLDVDSPGGLVRGVFPAADAIHASSKPVHARVSGMAASAGYLLASQADTITATGRADQIGSVGVAVDIWTSNRVVSIASSDAPDKRPDVETEQGKAVVRKELDDLHALFVDVIERGRGVSKATVDRDFGRGGVLLAADAVAVGMIDSLEEAASAPLVVAARLSGEPGASVGPMNEDTLQREHPELYARVTATAEERGFDKGKAAGIESEHARVLGHIEMGAEVGDMNVAVEQIKKPDSDPARTLAYQKSLIASSRIAARQDDAPEARGADESPEDDDAKLYADAARQCGVEVKFGKGA